MEQSEMGKRVVAMVNYTKQVTIKLWDIKCTGDCRTTVTNVNHMLHRCIAQIMFFKDSTCLI